MFIYALVGSLIGAVAVFIILQFVRKGETDELTTKLGGKIDQALRQAFNEANEQLVLMAEQKLGAEKKEIKTDLDNKKTAIKDLVERLLNEISRSNKKLEDTELERVGSFRELKKEVENQNEVTRQLSSTTENLRKVLSNNQLRGQFGEQVAEGLLKMVGFVRGVDYEFNKEQKESQTRPDFCVFLPDGVRINVDSKFPYANLQRAAETEDSGLKERYIAAFERDIKEKIKQVTTRDYINPESNTVDFVIMFIPNEMIFSFIYDRMNDVWTEAMRQKVVMAGPFSFTAILRLVRQAYDNFKYQKNVHQIIQQIKTFEREFAKYNEEFEKIGARIESLSSQYQRVNRTRTQQLNRTIDKIKLEGAAPVATLPSAGDKPKLI
ncbi:DNA recombination protein RmuC [Candidatus Parcubacteria bacterium]|nr:DNA recombination protein RmuC [Candidatus Parcubacteria bacterium]